MTGFDYVVFLVVGLAAIAGFFRGFVEEVLSLAAWCLAMLAVHYGHDALTTVLIPYVRTETGAGVLAFGILLAVPYFGMKIFARMVGNASRSSMLGPIDRVLGFGFGAIKGFVLMVLAFSLLVFANDVVWGPKDRPAWIRDGRTYPFLNAAGEELMTMAAHRRSAGPESDDPSDSATDPGIAPVNSAHHRAHRRPAPVDTAP